MIDVINTVLANRSKPLIQELNESTSLRDDLELDSLDLAELTVRIEAEFDVDVFKDGLVGTIGELVEKIPEMNE